MRAPSSTFLEKHPAVAWVKYPGLESHADHALAKKQMPRGAGAIMSFGIKAPDGAGEGGARRAGKVLIERLRLLSHLANIGDAKSLVIHPASTTHQQMSAAELAGAGVGEDLMRLSIGLEDARDIVEDLDQALKASAEGVSLFFRGPQRLRLLRPRGCLAGWRTISRPSAATECAKSDLGKCPSARSKNAWRNRPRGSSAAPVGEAVGDRGKKKPIRTSSNRRTSPFSYCSAIFTLSCCSHPQTRPRQAGVPWRSPLRLSSRSRSVKRR